MDTTHTAFIFPGQGSQSIGMGKDLALEFPAAAEIFAQADDILRFSLSSISWHGPDVSLNETHNTQPALFTHSIASLRVLQELLPNLHPVCVAGHSMGELSALTASGALSFAAGLRLARTRGELMKQAGDVSPGGMAAVLGLDIPDLERICIEASTSSEIVQVANDNCPGQVVISGSNTALDRVIPLLQEAGARRVVKLAVSIAAHSPLMLHAQQVFSQVVDDTAFSIPAIPIIGNVNAQPLSSPQSIRQDLREQLTHRVRWTESILHIQSLGVVNYIEVGNGTVLSGLVKRIDRQAETLTLGSPSDIEKLMQAYP